MTTAAPPRPDAAAPAPGRLSPPDPGRFAQWRSTWSVALRMARRDVRRHRGRSALVVVMVGVPTLLLSMLVTIATTSQVEGPELIPATMGSGQALVESPQLDSVVQMPDGSYTGSASVDDGDEGTAPPVPGARADADAFANADAVARLVGAPVSPVVSFTARTTIGDRRVTLEAEALDGSAGLGERLRLESGRWPRGTGEALVTASSIAEGLPSSGPIEVAVDGTPLTLDVVGVADSAARWSEIGLVTAVPPTPFQATGGGSWIVRGNDPVSWAEVRELNRYGLVVISAEVLRNPPPESELPSELIPEMESVETDTRLLVGLGSVMLLVSCTLLVGPAFAVSAARQRRTLALAASNGASTAAMRRTVLSQAVVLGGVSAVASSALGVVGAAGLTRWAERDGGLGLGGPLDIRPGLLAAVASCALLSTVVAALLPARRLGRLDIVGVMRGQSVSPRPSRLLFVLGAILSAVGGVLIVLATGAVPPKVGDGYGRPSVIGLGAEYVVTLGAMALIAGALFLVPLTLATVGRLGSRMPTSLRMAARDLARHRARSAPSVAAVLAAVAGLTFGMTGLESDTEDQRRDYTPGTLVGEALVSGYDRPLDPDSVRDALPGSIVEPVTAFGVPYGSEGEATSDRSVFVNVIPPGCEPADTLRTATPDGSPSRCAVRGTEANLPGSSTGVLMLPAAELARRLGLDAAQTQRVRDGAMVVRGLEGSEHRVARGTYLPDPEGNGDGVTDVRVEQDRTVSAVVVPQTAAVNGAMFGFDIAFAADSPFSTGWPLAEEELSVRMADGSAITETQVEQALQRLGDETWFDVERGFEREDQLVVAILLAVFALLILVVTLTSTALTLAEQQTDQATLAALGATRRTRRVMTAAQAFLLAAVGCALGVAVGLVPGIAIARILTTDIQERAAGLENPATGGALVIPWLSLLVVGVLVPLVAAGMAAAGIRRAPTVTRRAG
ncbi:MAG: FtsX-like permease family protein [Dermatophilaceae bacterium]